MAQYTIELRSLVETGYNVFDKSWDTFIPEHKAVLCDKILRRYWFYEIGQETPDRFKHYLNEQLARIMPYYNKLYESELLEIMPLYNYFMEGTEEEVRKLKRDKDRAHRTDLTKLMQMAESLERLEKGTLTGTAGLTGNQTETWNEDKSGKEDITKHEVSDGTQTTDEDTTEKTVASKTETITGKETGKEVMEDTADGSKTIDTSSNTTTNARKYYSDTPQALITGEGMGIEEEFLTNYTRDTGTQTVTGKETDTIKNTENKTTDTTKDTDNTTKTDGTTDVTGTKDVIVNTDETKDTTQGTTYSEDKDGKKTTNRTEDSNESNETTGTEHQFQNGTTQGTESAIGFENEKVKDSEETTGKNALKGFTVSQAELLQAYRKTFINIDNMIIETLAENFMGVF